MGQKTYHLLGLSGGKDSSALAVYTWDRAPEVEYFSQIPAKNYQRRMNFWIG